MNYKPNIALPLPLQTQGQCILGRERIKLSSLQYVLQTSHSFSLSLFFPTSLSRDVCLFLFVFCNIPFFCSLSVYFSIYQFIHLSLFLSFTTSLLHLCAWSLVTITTSGSCALQNNQHSTLLLLPTLNSSTHLDPPITGAHGSWNKMLFLWHLQVHKPVLYALYTDSALKRYLPPFLHVTFK